MEEIPLQLSILLTQNLVVHITRYSVALLFRCRPVRGHQESPANAPRDHLNELPGVVRLSRASDPTYKGRML